MLPNILQETEEVSKVRIPQCPLHQLQPLLGHRLTSKKEDPNQQDNSIEFHLTPESRMNLSFPSLKGLNLQLSTDHQLTRHTISKRIYFPTKKHNHGCLRFRIRCRQGSTQRSILHEKEHCLKFTKATIKKQDEELHNSKSFKIDIAKTRHFHSDDEQYSCIDQDQPSQILMLFVNLIYPLFLPNSVCSDQHIYLFDTQNVLIDFNISNLNVQTSSGNRFPTDPSLMYQAQPEASILRKTMLF